jgi:hypothetical protein
VAVTATVAALVSIGLHAQNALGTAAFENGRESRASRLVFSSAPQDDRERRRMFSRYLTPGCLIEQLTMEQPGTWTVLCGSGETIRLVYNRRAEVVGLTQSR